MLSLFVFRQKPGWFLTMGVAAFVGTLLLMPPGFAQNGKPESPKTGKAAKAGSKSRENSGTAADSDDSKPAKGRATRGKDVAPGPHDYSSRNFLVHTDLPPEEARELLERLETMLSLISKYWGKPNNKTIEMYVVKDLSTWPAGVIDGRGLQSIEDGAGVTLSQTAYRGGQAVDAKAVVYAVADRGTPQHEAVHAYCALNFGRTGPVWYSEGMAEMGQYWREKELGVQIHDVVLRYLQNSEPKTLAEIVSPDQVTGDSWQNYAWRWALCHLLANNTNYAARFRPLGLELLNANKMASFENTYGSMAKEISFEYLFFLKHLDQGYRADLCSWDWKTKANVLRPTAGASQKIDAKKGWQASRVQVKARQTFKFEGLGTWKVSPGSEAVGLAGDDEGHGMLEGVLFKDYELSEPFDLPPDTPWTAPDDGVLYLRCKDKWNELADNSGVVTVKIKLAN